jgi:hypothetical protein
LLPSNPRNQPTETAYANLISLQAFKKEWLRRLDKRNPQRSRNITGKELLSYLNEKQIRELCRLYGISNTGLLAREKPPPTPRTQQEIQTALVTEGGLGQWSQPGVNPKAAPAVEAPSSLGAPAAGVVAVFVGGAAAVPAAAAGAIVVMVAAARHA